MSMYACLLKLIANHIICLPFKNMTLTSNFSNKNYHCFKVL